MLRIPDAAMVHDAQGRILCPHGKPLKSVDVFTGEKMRKEWWFPHGEALGHSDVCTRCAIGLTKGQLKDKLSNCISRPVTPLRTKSQRSAYTPPARELVLADVDDRQRLLSPTQRPHDVMIAVNICPHREAHIPAGTNVEVVKKDWGTCWKCKSRNIGRGIAVWLPLWCWNPRNDMSKSPSKITNARLGMRTEID